MPTRPPDTLAQHFVLLLVLAALGIVSLVPIAHAQSQGRSFYVDPAGSDSNSGTSPESPWRSIAKVNALALEPGDTIYFKRSGEWRETIEPRRGGAPGQPVTFTAYGNGPQPIISGSDIIRGWTRGDGAIYRAHSQKPVNVYVDGRPGWGLLHACCAPGSACVPERFVRGRSDGTRKLVMGCRHRDAFPLDARRL